MASCAALPACGGGGGGRPGPISGSFVQLAGPEQGKTISLGSIKCTPKPGLKEYEVEASSSDGDSLHVVLMEYQGPGERDIEFGVTKPKHRIDIDLASGHKYRFFQHLRSDLNEIYNSYCHVAIVEGGGHLNCTLLWADAGSPDFAGTEFLNNYVDANAKFDCGS